MENLLIRKLEAFGPLPTDDRTLLNDVIREPRSVGPRVDLIAEGDAPTDVHLILEGFACRYKMLPNGTRQIMAYLVPGDFCDLHIFILKAMDHGIATLSRCNVVGIPRTRVLGVNGKGPPFHGRSGGPRSSMRPPFASGWSISAAARQRSASPTFCASCCCG